ncbi:MAG: TIGR00725 family protein [Candidatus Aegiribacteria sp.]|nr:TIGR00725 family protein [Candidatus Aegiribacteria sp.]
MTVNLVAVIGGAIADPEEYSLARELGRNLADEGYTIVCGGGTGIMEAVCRGAREAGGHTIGVLPGVNPSDANEYVETVLVTGMGTSRNRIISLSGRVVVAVGGMYGTLSEIAFALQAGRPVCAMGTWNVIDGVTPVNSPQEALEFVRENFRGIDAEHN